MWETHAVPGQWSWAPWCWYWRFCWGQRSQSSMSLQPPDPDREDVPVEEEPGRLTYLGKAKRVSQPPEPCLSTVWAESWQQVKWRTVVCSVTSVTTFVTTRGGALFLSGAGPRTAASSWYFCPPREAHRVLFCPSFSSKNWNAIFSTSLWGVWDRIF